MEVLNDVNVMLLAREMCNLTASVEKQRMWLIESGLETWSPAASSEVPASHSPQ